MSRGARLTAHSAVSTSLALCGDRALSKLVDTAVPIGTGIGGTSALLEVAGTPVFVKRVPLTDPERQPEHLRSTANLFELPVFCQYGIGGPGFGAWRELAVHIMTTNWVLAAEYEGFPLMYHWRVLPDSTPLPEELADIERAVAYWGGRSQVRRRIQRHQTYDRCYTATYLVNWLVTALYGYQREDQEGRYALVRAYAEGKRPTGIPEEAAAILTRHAPIAAAMSDFNRKLQRQSRQTPYPLQEIRQLGGMYSSSLR
ncbi:hypothetical protein [Streptomyces sp. XD-27]|uniref:hypothetical protein n=1 Tax=Streptomyces sp. XD-27 TaxID=3062779 RepID=UPI0026F4698F|nr:hypothetical protein [Streptomyces sp. XD-27]WKX74132.1 hypothetical protein Q3Y56_04760 [Streptomyces sp. XD-27]